MAAAVRIGLIGLGRWGQVYVRALAALPSRCRLTHVGTRHPERLKGLGAAGATVVPDWADVIQAECDAVIVATPPQTHAALLEACLEAGKPCIIEKPLCLDLAAAERLHRRVAASRVPVLVDHTQLFSPSYGAVKEALAREGEPIRVVWSEGMALGPFRDDVPALWDWAPHDVSLCLDLFGQAPSQVAALGGPRNAGGAPEMVSLRLEFPAGGCGWIHAGRLSPARRRALSVFTDTRIYRADDSADPAAGVAPFAFAARSETGRAEPVEFSPLGPASSSPAMDRMLNYFLDGLAGGDRTKFGTGLATEVVRTLSACEPMLHPSRKR